MCKVHNKNKKKLCNIIKDMNPMLFVLENKNELMYINGR